MAGEQELLGEAVAGRGALAGLLVEAKRQWHYWRSQHARAKQRGEQWRARWRAAQQQLQAAQQTIAQLQAQVAELEQQQASLQQRNQELLHNRFGKRSEKQRAGSATGTAPQPRPAGAGDRPPPAAGPPRSRGGQPGAGAHGRLDRSPLAVQEEVHEPAPESRVCAACGRAYVRNGAQVCERLEVQVRGYVRRIRRPRYRAVCDCAPGPAPPQAIAELEPALFRGSNYGLSVWVEFLLQVYWQRRPVRAFEREWGACGVRLPASTLLGHLRDFLTWCEPLEMALEQHQQQARWAHGDETSWVVRVRSESDLNPHCWMWACLTSDAVRFRVDPTRSAAAAQALFGELGQQAPLVLVCDRYAAYGKLARECAGQFVLAICWVHARRDFVTLGRRWPEQQAWVEQILERIARLYQLNAQRLPLWQARYEDCLAGQSAPFQAAQQALSAACAELFEHAAQELAALQAAAESAAPGASPDPRLAPLQSLLRYRRGLSVFLSKPFVPLDNNPVERILRRLVVGRKLSYGSHSEEGAVLQGRLLSVLTTLALAGIDLRRWLAAFLGECARIGRTAVVRQPQAWLPWDIPAPRRQALLAAGRAAPPGPDP